MRVHATFKVLEVIRITAELLQPQQRLYLNEERL